MQTQEQQQPKPKWGDPISPERQAELRGHLDGWEVEADHGTRKGPFDHEPGQEIEWLTGADVAWLAEYSGRDDLGNTPDLHLEGAYFYRAHLEGANLAQAHLEWAYLYGAHLEGANLAQAHLEGATLGGAWLDSKTVLSKAWLDTKTQLGDIHWSGVGGVDLTQINWSPVTRLGDELALKWSTSVDDHEAAVRAYRQLAAQLRAQGMSEVADRFLYRVPLLYRRVLRKRGNYPRWFGSLFISALAGYGYRPGRSILWYLSLIAAFAVSYYLLGPTQGHTFQPDGALVFSLTSFHGRGFFPESLSLESWVTRLAALEAVLGLLIEISFIATFTQRFFNAR